MRKTYPFFLPGSAAGHMDANDYSLLSDTVLLQHKSGDSGLLVRQIWTGPICICGLFKG